MKRAVDRMKIQQFLKRNKTAQNLYDRGMGALDFATGRGMYTGSGLYTGMGEYMPSSNSLITKSSMEVVPQFAAETDSGVIISKREYVSEIYGPASGPFAIQSFALNPGLESTFPWLSQIAQNYDEYELLQCIFTFKSTTTESVNSLNGQVGTIIMATSYNAALPNFTDKVSMMQYEFSNSARLTESLQHGVECDPAKLSGSRGEYIRANPVVVGQDLKTYDHGKFQIAVANCASAYNNQSIGELWVSYTVKLRKSKFFTALGLGISKDIYVSSGAESFTNPFGLGANSLSLKGQQNNIGILLTNPAANSTMLTFPAAYKGRLQILFTVAPAINAGLAIPYTNCSLGTPLLTGNVSFVSDLYGNANSTTAEVGDFPAAGVVCCSVTLGLIYILHINVEVATGGTDNTLTIVTNLTAATGAPSQAYLDVSEYNSGFSYKATGLGTSEAPVWLNSSGVVSIPN